jgi:hypothetical protein
MWLETEDLSGTSHSSQGQTADRVLIHVDIELGAKDPLNSRMAYVSVAPPGYLASLDQDPVTVFFTHLRDSSIFNL